MWTKNTLTSIVSVNDCIENIPEFDGFLVDEWYFDVLYRGASVHTIHTLRPLTLHTLTLYTLAALTAAIVRGR